jgi:hypothetical protein
MLFEDVGCRGRTRPKDHERGEPLPEPFVVKGPREKRYIGGIGIENFLSVGHLKYAAGVNTTVWSYDKLLNFTVYGCARTLPDAELYTARILSSFDELRSATIGLDAAAS